MAWGGLSYGAIKEAIQEGREGRKSAAEESLLANVAVSKGEAGLHLELGLLCLLQQRLSTAALRVQCTHRGTRKEICVVQLPQCKGP